ncbi:ABC transporter substrate-binding protein, partial [Marinobacter sp.]|uniref:ABC transporter substrate-binding protein n=1 Tax=Marinobacter sp. TaxID=50741 RepID=UPI003F9E102F
MKKLLAAIVGSMALATAPVALSAEATKEIKMAYDADPVTLDIHEQLSGGILQLSHMSFDPLVRWTKDLGFEARLAESWERVDDKTMRFKLREGVKFHSGNELTTKDVKFTYDRLKESQDFKAIFKPFSGINVIDDYTFELVTNDPFPLLLNTATYIFPLDSEFYSGETEDGKKKDAILKHGSSFASDNLSGTGPYTVKSRQQGVRMEFERFADYWDE